MIVKENIYFVGIGGIGMSALARYFHQLGKKVAGYDKNTTTLTKRLQTEGMRVTDFSDADAIPVDFRDPENTLVVYTPAISVEHPMLEFFREEQFEIKKRAEVLGDLSKGMHTIAVAGTHGKTTVSSMIAYLLHSNGIKVNAILGGISRDFGTNLVLDPEAKILVTEADEYDRSFLQLHPNHLVITSIDADHLDIYEDEEDLKSTYSQLVACVEAEGEVIAKPSVLRTLDIPSGLKKRSYAIGENAFITAKNINVHKGNFRFNYESEKSTIVDVSCGLPGIHNVENALAAITVAQEFDIADDKLKESIGQFRGVKRRFDIHLKNEELVYIDDYAHHPQEIKMLLSSVRELYPDQRITTIFQPHLFSRTRDFGKEFAEELGKSDDLILLEIYPAREEPIEGIDALWLSRLIGKEDVAICEKHHLMNILKTKEIEVLLTVGAGDIDTMVEPIIEYYGDEE